MELNVWTKTTIKDSKWDDDKREWTVELEREKDGKKETRQYIHIPSAKGLKCSCSF